MRFVRFGPPGREQPGLLHEAPGAALTIRDLSGRIPDIAADALSPAALAELRALDPTTLPEVCRYADRATEGVRLGPPITRPHKLIGIGKNYADHAAETGGSVPKEPMVFMKATSAIAGPDDPIELPPASEHLDWEVELAVVIGERAKRIEQPRSIAHILGYCLINDVSERDWQKNHFGQFVKGKSHDTFAPLGPWLATTDEIPEPQALRLWTEVDATRRQDGTTADMIFGVRTLVAYLSAFMTLEPGDIIATGTPAGVAMGMDPPPYLRPGQTVTLGVEGLGEQRHEIVESS